MGRITIYEVAKKAGVSVATVSRALNGDRVAPKTRAKVLEAIRALGYRPDRMALTLASGKSRTVGVVHPRQHRPPPLRPDAPRPLRRPPRARLRLHRHRKPARPQP